MSRGGTSIGSSQQRASASGQHAGRLLREIVRSGKSFSGRERNRCFLNTGQKRWANVSAISGLDVPDDGRATAITDWDGDGDLDLWVVNRSGPQIRFFQNNLDRDKTNSFVTLRLRGSPANRDAIGTRVELHLSNPKRTQIKTLRAGDGYLSQSSKTIHFGIPKNCSVDGLTIRWPGGAKQQISSIQSGKHYEIAQGGSLELRDRSSTGSPPTLHDAPTEPLAGANRVMLNMPIPVPQLTYSSFDGSERVIGSRSGQHQLVSLWATWCEPCIAELAGFSQRTKKLREANINVVALCVDELDEATALSTPTLALEQINFSFDSGNATSSTVDILQIINNHLFDLHRPLPLPCSILLNPDGKLAAIYKGPINTEQVIRDVGQSAGSASARRNEGIPFPGRWAGPPRQSRHLMLALSMLDAGRLEETLNFVKAEQPLLSADKEFDVLLFNMGQKFTQRGRHEQATQLYRQALRVNPRLSSAHYNLALTFLQAGNQQQATYHLEQTVALEPNSPDALHYLGNIAAKLGQTSKATDLLNKALAISPNRADTHFQLAVVSAVSGSLDEGIRHYRSAVALEPERFADEQRNGRIVAALKLGLRSLQSNATTSPRDLSRWKTEIEHVNQMKQ